MVAQLGQEGIHNSSGRSVVGFMSVDTLVWFGLGLLGKPPTRKTNLGFMYRGVGNWKNESSTVRARFINDYSHLMFVLGRWSVRRFMLWGSLVIRCGCGAWVSNG